MPLIPLRLYGLQSSYNIYDCGFISIYIEETLINNLTAIGLFMAVITGLVRSCYSLMLILTVMQCNEKKSWTTLKGNHSRSSEEQSLNFARWIRCRVLSRH